MLKIVYANTPELIDGVFKVRHRVFVEEERLLRSSPDARISDRYDAYPTTRNLAVISGEDVIGSFRLAVEGPVGMPADQYYDFRKHLPKGSRLLHAGMFCLRQSHRGAGLTTALGLMAVDLAVAENVTHIVSPINPRVGRLLERGGFEVVGEEFNEPLHGVPMVPEIFDVERRAGAYAAFVAQHQLRDFLGDYERWYGSAGETIISQGAVADGVYLIVDGTARIASAERDRPAAEFGPGAILMSHSPHDEDGTGDIIADSDIQIMVWRTDGLASRIAEQMARTPDIAKIFVKQTQAMIGRLEKSTA